MDFYFYRANGKRDPGLLFHPPPVFRDQASGPQGSGQKAGEPYRTREKLGQWERHSVAINFIFYRLSWGTKSVNKFFINFFIV